MANTTTAAELVVKKYLADFFREYVRTNRFSKETGTGVNNVITIKEGKQLIEVPLVTRLAGAGVTGSSTLRGNGEKIGNYGFTLTPTYKRHAVEFDKEELDKPAIDLMNAARPLLMDWSMELTRDDIIEAMGAVHNGTSYFAYGTASNANHDSWLSNNTDRVHYGVSTQAAQTDHSTGLGLLDNTADKLTTAAISKMKVLAKNARPRIRPIKTKGDEEWYIAYMDSYCFRDLKANLDTQHQNAGVRGRDNPIFRDNDLVVDGVICREVAEIADFIDNAADGLDLWGASATANSLKTGGAGSIRVSPVFFCGAQAVGFGLGQRPNVIVDLDYDFNFQPGVAVECKHDIKKAFFDDHASGTASQHKQHGIVTGFFASVI